MRKHKAQLAKVISTEMGKIFSEAEAEIETCAHEASAAEASRLFRRIFEDGLKALAIKLT